MSLLLEALKKAEKAKEEAQRRAKGDEPVEPNFDTDATVVDTGRHVTTRDELPDISAPLEILSDDIRPEAQSSAAAPALALVDEPPPAPQPKATARRDAPRAAQAAADPASAGRASAQKVFEAKFKEPNPRLPFYIAVGMLAALGVGTGIYFWIQLRPAPSLVNANPPRPSGEKPVEAAAGKPAAAAPAQSGPGPAAIPGLPGGTAQGAAAPAPATLAPTKPSAAAPAPETPVAAAPAVAKAGATPRAKPAAAAKTEETDLKINRGGPQIHPRVAAGYAAYQAGDLAKARGEYEQVLREEPANRDALLGLAAVEMRAQRYDLADAHYQRILQADPRDPHAQAGMLALRGQQLDPVQVESRVKSLLAADREATVLYFTLGNQYAQQGRWAEAQQAYFKAFATDPDNPDFAFNLAVSMDQLRQSKLALEYYRRALAAAEKRSANFSLDTARNRVQQLSR